MTMSGVLDALPILLLIGLGVLLRLVGLIDTRSGLVLTRLAYYVTIPAAIFTGIGRSAFSPSLLFFPALGLALPAVLAAIIWLTTRRIADKPALRGVMMSGMVLLGVFGYPFLDLFFGGDGLARMALYDVGNSIYAGTAALWLAQRYGAQARRGPQSDGAPPSSRPSSGLRKVLTSPVMLAAALGVLVSVYQLRLPAPAADLLNRLTAANTPLAMIAVGVFVRPRASHAGLMAQYMLVRLLLGGLLGWAAALAMGMGGLDIVVACTASTLPMGTTTLIYAGNEGLDPEFAASLISITVILGALLINVLPHVLAAAYL